MTDISGASLIGGEQIPGGPPGFHGIDPRSNAALEPLFGDVSAADIERACGLAAAAFDIYRDTDPVRRGRFLDTIADRIDAIGAPLIARASAETGLPPARIEGERARTTGQLRLFAETVRQGGWLDVRIDPALPERTPLPRPDLRLRNIGVGPVAVFGSSNFPLAFSVAGGDTAAALAAGCPVVVKGHPAHPGTAALVGRAIQEAVAACGLPPGVFALLFGAGNALGTALVANPAIKAVGFTGSRAGGMALAKVAADRREPIPVHAEMSSVNPVLLLPAALASRGEAIAREFVASLTLGAGQFCTNPGLIIAVDSAGLDHFIATAAEALRQAPPAVMLTAGIAAAYTSGVSKLRDAAAVTAAASGAPGDGPNLGQPALFTVPAAAYLAEPHLADEVFGASALLVRCPDEAALRQVVEALEGQLTCTLQMDEADHPAAQRLLPILERKAGRLLMNGWPTGVEVSNAMVHGGPFPATTDSRTTSVGTLAIRRFLRPVCYQNWPDALLPDALRDANPYAVARLLDGRLDVPEAR